MMGVQGLMHDVDVLPQEASNVHGSSVRNFYMLHFKNQTLGLISLERH